MLTVFWGSGGLVLVTFQEWGDTIKSATYCDILHKKNSY